MKANPPACVGDEPFVLVYVCCLCDKSLAGFSAATLFVLIKHAYQELSHAVDAMAVDQICAACCSLASSKTVVILCGSSR